MQIVGVSDIQAIYQRPFMDLIFDAAQTHRVHHHPNKIQRSTLLSIKTGGCPEDCGYCSQSAHFKTHVKREDLLPLDAILKRAQQAKELGATRFCMGAAWRRVPDQELPKLKEAVTRVRKMGMETCLTLGTLSEKQAVELKQAGLDYYNHNLDTSREYYSSIITTRSFDERLQTLQHVRDAGINVCCGGILGMGETEQDRFHFLWELYRLPNPPESIPLNAYVPIPGTPLANEKIEFDGLDFVRTVATTRILFPKSDIRLSAGRNQMSDELQTLCFFAGANSIFYGEQLLTAANPETNRDHLLFERLGLEVRGSNEHHASSY